MGRIDAGYACTRCPQERAEHPGIDAALGAVSVQESRPQCACSAGAPGAAISPGPIWRCIGEAPHAEREAGLTARRTGPPRTRRRWSKSQTMPTAMAGFRLRLGQIAHMAEDPADRRAEAVDDAGSGPGQRRPGTIRTGVRGHRWCRPAAAGRVDDAAGHHLAVDVAGDIDIGLVWRAARSRRPMAIAFCTVMPGHDRNIVRRRPPRP